MAKIWVILDPRVQTTKHIRHANGLLIIVRAHKLPTIDCFTAKKNSSATVTRYTRDGQCVNVGSVFPEASYASGNEAALDARETTDSAATITVARRKASSLADGQPPR